MKTAGYRCQNISCHIYIEEENIFTENTLTDTVSKDEQLSGSIYILTLVCSLFSEL